MILAKIKGKVRGRRGHQPRRRKKKEVSGPFLKGARKEALG